MKVVLIGSGNVNTVLGRRMVTAGHPVLQVISKNIANARQLAAALNSIAADNISAIREDADIYILSVSDTALPLVAGQLHLDQQLVVHTTGAGAIQLLQGCSARYGVLYPLQSLRKEMQGLPVIPLFIDGNTPAVKETLTGFAQTLSPVTGYADDAGRLKLHVAAVVASNFTNFLYTQAELFCRQEHIDFRALLPLIAETASRVQQYSPAQVQTGPAIRKDVVTVEKHLQALKPYPELADLYQHLSNAIMAFYSAADA